MICDLHKKQPSGGEEKGCFQNVVPPVSTHVYCRFPYYEELVYILIIMGIIISHCLH